MSMRYPGDIRCTINHTIYLVYMNKVRWGSMPPSKSNFILNLPPPNFPHCLCVPTFKFRDRKQSTDHFPRILPATIP